MSCWPGQLPLLHRDTRRPVPASASVDTLSSFGSFEMLGGGDIEALRSALFSDDVPLVRPDTLETLEVKNKSTQGFGVFKKRDDYVADMMPKSAQ